MSKLKSTVEYPKVLERNRVLLQGLCNQHSNAEGEADVAGETGAL